MNYIKTHIKIAFWYKICTIKSNTLLFLYSSEVLLIYDGSWINSKYDDEKKPANSMSDLSHFHKQTPSGRPGPSALISASYQYNLRACISSALTLKTSI